MKHKYKVGQMVEFTPSKTALLASIRPYQIVRLVPLEGLDARYRIKCATEAFERVANETELSTK